MSNTPEPQVVFPLPEKKSKLVPLLKQYGRIDPGEVNMWKNKMGGDVEAALMMMVTRRQVKKLLQG